MKPECDCSCASLGLSQWTRYEIVSTTRSLRFLLEIVYGAIRRGFESRPLRHTESIFYSVIKVQVSLGGKGSCLAHKNKTLHLETGPPTAPAHYAGAVGF